MATGLYKPAVTLKAAKRRTAELQKGGLLDDGQSIYDLFNEEGEATRALAGDILMEVPIRGRKRRDSQQSQSQQSQSEPGGSGEGREFTEEDLRGVEYLRALVRENYANPIRDSCLRSPGHALCLG